MACGNLGAVRGYGGWKIKTLEAAFWAASGKTTLEELSVPLIWAGGGAGHNRTLSSVTGFHLGAPLGAACSLERR